MIRRALLVVVCLALAGEASPADKQIERLQIQIANLQSQVITLQRIVEDSLKEIRELGENIGRQNGVLRKGLEEQRLQSEATQATLHDVVDRLGRVNERLDAMQTAPAFASGLAPTSVDGGEESGDVPLATSSAPPPRELYSQAYADFARGNYDLAVQGFEEYLRNYPDTDFSDNARYWIGECLYGKEQYEDAIGAWNELLRDFPSSDKVPDARVKKGMALERLGRRSQALLEYRYVLDRYPNAPAARIARQKLNPE